MASLPRFLRLGPYERLSDWARSLAVTLTAAGFLAYAEAFNSGRAGPVARFLYWFGLMFLGWAWGVVVSSLFFREVVRPRSLWLRIVASALVLAVPYSAVVAYATMLVMHAHFRDLGDIAELVLSVLAVSLLMIAINVLIGMRHPGGVTSASAQPPKFLDRLPLKLRGAQVWAVEAEDHYLRLHTSKGQDLILMRLSDAISELEGIEGAQVHRSWWVGREAIAEAVRGDGRATLTLKDGAEVPVSRTYARQLRQSGWI